MLKKYSLKNFEAFSRKDLGTIEGMLSMDVSLKDWDISAKGRKDVLQATHNILNSVETIKVTALEVYRVGYSIIAKIRAFKG